MDQRRTKILATLGPATDQPGRLDAMIAAGIDGGRINCAHDGPDRWRDRSRALREAAARVGRPLSLVFDLAGPKIRLARGVEGRDLAVGDEVTFCSTDRLVDGAIGVEWPGLVEAITIGRSEIVIGDGTPRLAAVAADPERGTVLARCERVGRLGPRKGFFVTYVRSPAATLGQRDLADLAVAIEVGADMIALSFVRNGQDVRRLRGALDAVGSRARVVAKIEKVEAWDALDEILSVADGIMVARGDLGVEAGVARVPLIQKDVIRRAAASGKLVITATQMLESMIASPEPTRAEATDIANAILDGTSAVMLSGETTIGRYPVEAVQAMAEIAREAERGAPFGLDVSSPVANRTEAVMQAGVHLANQIGADALVVTTISGGSARAAAKYRPRHPIIALSEDETVRRQLALEWGVVPGRLPKRPTSSDDHAQLMIARARRIAGLRRGATVVLAYGPHDAGPAQTSFLAVRDIV